MRICRGIYMKTGAKIPNDIEIAEAIARKTNSQIQVAYIDTKDDKCKIVVYTDGSTRNLKLPNGTTIAFRHKDNFDL